MAESLSQRLGRQCCALNIKDKTRCSNSVYGRDVCCGVHKSARGVRLAPDEDDRDWFECRVCGWQPATWKQGGGGPPYCSGCGLEYAPGFIEWEKVEIDEESLRVVADA